MICTRRFWRLLHQDSVRIRLGSLLRHLRLREFNLSAFVHKFRRKIHTVGVQFYGRGESFFLGNYNMIVKSIAVGDMFLNVNGDRVTILEIECGLDEDENRWETSIKYERFSNGVSAKITEKARVVVQMLGGNEFYSQVYPSGDVTKSNVIKPRG